METDRNRFAERRSRAPVSAVRVRWRVSFEVTEGLSIAQIAERLGRSPATIKAYF
jgi:DNA-binding NarL/FixJ family response regulator